MARILDVAREAGVSVASVSRVLQGQSGVSEETKKRVQAAIDALGYRPDLAARRLRSRRTDTLGLIVSDIRNPFFTEISRAVEDVAYANGLRVMLCNADEDPAKEAFYLELMRDEKVSGVILSSTLQLLGRFNPADYPFPIVLVDRCERDTDADAVLLDNMDAAQRLTRHLIEQGCRRIVFLYGAVSSSGRQRHDGYVAAMKAAQLAPEAEPLQPNVERARVATAALLLSGKPPDAIVASNGLILLGLIESVRAAGLEIPRDVRVAGFDDLPWTRLMTPPVTVIAQPTYEIGRSAIELLLQRIAKPEQVQRRVVLRGELIVRGSTISAPLSAQGTVFR